MAKPPTRDFAKRPKAKVGKRAPSKINATDTSFKTASVAVRSQGQSLDKNKVTTTATDAGSSTSLAALTELASSRGNALSTLQLSLRHHAPAVRASGLKGIRDAVQSLSTIGDAALGTSILEANLPSLVPNMCRCWLDEDDDVRSLAIHLFGDVLNNLTSSLNEQSSDLKCLVPFVPFLCAYASSALNSLDRDIRKDGALIVGMLSSSQSSLSFSSLSSSDDDREGGTMFAALSAMSIEVGKHVDLFIPSIERLLSSMSLGGRSRGNNGSSNAKKRKRGDAKTQSASSTGTGLASSDVTILSLGLLLRASLASEGNSMSTSNTNTGIVRRRLDPSLVVTGESTFLKGGSASANALLILREGGRSNNNNPIRSIWDLPTMPSDDLVHGIENAYANDETIQTSQPTISTETDDLPLMEKIQRLNTLLETLRMKFVELTHSCRSHEKGGLIVPTIDLDTMDILIQTIRFVNQRCQCYQTLIDRYELVKQSTRMENTVVQRQSKKDKKKAKKAEVQDLGECLVEYQMTVSKTLTLLLETFPIHPMDSSSISRYELTNAGVCSSLAELGGDNIISEDGRDCSSQWISSVFGYILPRLNSTDTATENDSPERIATNMLLKVVSKLLLPHGVRGNNYTGELANSYLLNNPLKRHELLKAFGNAFFPPTNEAEKNIKKLASTSMGRTAAMLLTTLVTQSADGILHPPSNDDKNNLYEKNSLLLLQMSSVLPHYLISWEGELPIETGRVIASIISIVRQWNENNMEENESTTISTALNDLCLGLRSSLVSLYTRNKKKPSIFERLPEQVQKLCVGLIGLLKCPSEILVKSLSSICSKSYANKHESVSIIISDSMANYIMEVMHSLRKFMPMSVYITFLIDSCGIKRANGNVLQNIKMANGEDAASDALLHEAVFSYDRSISQLCRFLTTSCDQASVKVLPMIRPVLLTWLSLPPTSSPTHDNFKQLVQARAAISILAAFTWDEVLCYGCTHENTKFIEPVFLKQDEDFDKHVVDCIIAQFELSSQLWSMEGGSYMDDLEVQQQYLARLLGPITLLLRFRRGMFGQFVETVSRRVVQQNKEQDKDSNTAALEDQEGSQPSKTIQVAEVHMNALLLVLKSKVPVSIVELVRNSNELQVSLLSSAEKIEHSVSGRHLAHLGSKLVHQTKLM